MLTWLLFKNYLFSHRSGALIRIISWLCVAGVTIGVASLIVVMSVMNGFNESIRHKLLLSKPHIIVKNPKHDVDTYRSLLPEGTIESIYNIEKQDLVIKTMDGIFGGAIANGLNQIELTNMIRRLRSENIGSEGSFLSMDEMGTLSPGEVIVGLGLAKNLNIYEGDTLVIIPPEALLLPAGEAPFYSRARVKAIIQTELQDVDNETLYYNIEGGLRSLQESNSRTKEIYVRLQDVNGVDRVKSAFISAGIEADSWKDRDKAMLFALRMEKIIIGTFIGLSTLITAFTILTVLVLLITQKRKDIGILMSMGLSLRETRWLFIRLGMVLSSFGLFAGVAIGLSLSVVLDEAKLDLLPQIYYDTSIPVSIDWLLVAGAITVGLSVALIGTYLPTTLTLRYAPAEALRAKV